MIKTQRRSSFYSQQNSAAGSLAVLCRPRTTRSLTWGGCSLNAASYTGTRGAPGDASPKNHPHNTSRPSPATSPISLLFGPQSHRITAGRKELFHNPSELPPQPTQLLHTPHPRGYFACARRLLAVPARHCSVPEPLSDTGKRKMFDCWY